MPPKQYELREDDEFVYVTEELLKYLPKEYRDAAQARKQQGEDVLRIGDKDIQGLIRLINAIPSTSSLSYIYHRLRTSIAEVTPATLMEQDVLTTAFIVTYARLFASGNGAIKLSKSDIPNHLKSVHDEIMDLRHKRYAHNDVHQTVSTKIEVIFNDDGFLLRPQISIGLCLGGRDEWRELIAFIDAHVHERLFKILDRLTRKTGYKWSFPSGPAPGWIGDYG
ncbi:hypothetical protein [Tropicimonas sp. IMCC34011]|uniref:hypothetical protein n=1 Tax=Tropicimonas sp. IMCC34011 TaxID=2248759 RepID=UPI00130074F4|nr:hypothetical protein [Tropicimonas sp. IMCC34011]